MKKQTSVVFIVSLILTGVIAVWAVALNDSFTAVSNVVLKFISQKFGWLYLIVMLFFIIFAVGIACSKYGKIRLGPDDSKPEYKTVSWFAMLFG